MLLIINILSDVRRERLKQMQLQVVILLTQRHRSGDQQAACDTTRIDISESEKEPERQSVNNVSVTTGTAH